MSRTEYAIPDGWRPAAGGHVTLLATRDEPVPPPGKWRIVSRSPSTASWWLQAADDAARAWANRNPTRVSSGCIDEQGRRLMPYGYAPPKTTRRTGR